MGNHLKCIATLIVIMACILTSCGNACGNDTTPTQYDVTSFETFEMTTTLETTSYTIEVTSNEINVSLSDKDLISAEFMPIDTIKVTSELVTTPPLDDYIEETTSSQTQEENSYYIALSNQEYDMVCAVVQAEANGGSLEFKEYIAGIIYNRVQSDNFPNSVYGVLTQENQFGSISNYYYNTYPIDDDTRLAVSRIFGGYDTYILYNLNGAVAYCNPNLVDSSTLNWFETSLRFTYQCTEYSNGITWVHRFYAIR